MKGRVLDYSFATHHLGEDPQYHVAKVMTAPHPGVIARDPERYDEFVSVIRQFHGLTPVSYTHLTLPTILLV